MIRNKSKNPNTINTIFGNKNVTKYNISSATKFKIKSNHVYRCCTRIMSCLQIACPFLCVRTHAMQSMLHRFQTSANSPRSQVCSAHAQAHEADSSETQTPTLMLFVTLNAVHVCRSCLQIACPSLCVRTHAMQSMLHLFQTSANSSRSCASLQCSCAGPRSGLIGNADTHAHDIYGCIIALWQACHSHALLVFQTPGPLAQVCSHQRVPSHMSHSHVLIQASSAVQTLRI